MQRLLQPEEEIAEDKERTVQRSFTSISNAVEIRLTFSGEAFAATLAKALIDP